MKRKPKAKTIIIFFLLAVVTGMLLFAAALRISVITCEGNEKCSQESIEAYLFKKDIDRNPFVFLFQSFFLDNKEIPFIEKYDVEMVSLTEFKINVYENSVIGYLKYMGTCMYFDKDGIVVEVTDTELEGIVNIRGIEFDHIVVNEKIPVKDKATFDTLLDITQLIDYYGIHTDYIDINKKLEITLYLDKVRVELGENDNFLSEKINDLSSIISVLENIDGVLDMREYSTSDKGYTFKKD